MDVRTRDDRPVPIKIRTGPKMKYLDQDRDSRTGVPVSALNVEIRTKFRTGLDYPPRSGFLDRIPDHVLGQEKSEPRTGPNENPDQNPDQGPDQFVAAVRSSMVRTVRQK